MEIGIKNKWDKLYIGYKRIVVVLDKADNKIIVFVFIIKI